MEHKQILHRLLLGMDPYLSCGVPTPYWDLAVELTREIYGDAGVKLLETSHKTYDDAVDARHTIILHSLNSWEDNGNTEITPQKVVERLEALAVV